MAGDSSSPGFLAPTGQPAYDEALADLLQAAVVGITGLDGSLVRPRWQPEPPQQPDFATNWCAMGITKIVADAYSYDRADPSGAFGSVEEDEAIMVLHSFYGPACYQLCERFRKGMMLAQNRDALLAQGVLLTGIDESVEVPALLKSIWVRRVDINVEYRRRAVTTYPVLSVQHGQMGLNNELWVTPITVT